MLVWLREPFATRILATAVDSDTSLVSTSNAPEMHVNLNLLGEMHVLLA